MFTKSCGFILLFTVLFSLTISGAPTAHAENWALLVGIDDYQFIAPDLRFCESDADRMKNALINYAGFKASNIKTLMGPEATKKNVRTAFREWLINNVKPGDKALFYFSGHGVQMSNPNALEEEDRKDELLCVYDSKRHVYTFIRDNEIGYWMDGVYTNQKIVIFDACHSGTATRSLVGFGEQSANVPGVKAYYPAPEFEIRESTIDEIKAYDPDLSEAELAAVLGAAGTRSASSDSGGESSISGCEDHQVSMESPAIPGGVMTNYLIESMQNAKYTDKNGDGAVTVHELWDETKKRIKKKGWYQDPKYTGTNEIALIGSLAGNAPPETPTPESNTSVTDYDGTVVQSSGEEIQLSIGKDDGVTRGSIYAVHDKSGNRKSQIRITRVEATTAYALPVEGTAGTIHVGDLVVGERHYVESEDLLLLVQPIKTLDTNSQTIAVRLTDKLREKVSSLPNVKLVDEKQAPDRILAGTIKSNGGLFDVSLRLINVNIGNSTPEYKLKMRSDQVDTAIKTLFSDHQNRDQKVEGFTSLIRASYVLKALINLENPKPKFKINVTLNKGDLATYEIGEMVEISVEPDRSCYIYVLDIGTSGRITMLFPSEFEPNNFVRRGQKYTVPSPDAEYEIPVGGPPGEERIKIIATTQKLPLEGLRPEDWGSQIKTYFETAPQLLQESMRDLSLKPRHTWTAETVMFTIGRPKVYASRAPLELSILE